MRLDSLIIAINRATRPEICVTLRRRSLHDDDHGISIANVPDRLVDSADPIGAYRDQLLAENESRQVEESWIIMSSRGRRSVRYRRSGAAQRSREVIERISRAPIACSATLAQRREIWIEAAIEADHERCAGLLDDLEEQARTRSTSSGSASRRRSPSWRALRAQLDRRGCRSASRWRPRPWKRGGRSASISGTFAPSASPGRRPHPDPRRRQKPPACRGRRTPVDLADPTRSDDPEPHALLPFW